MRQHARPSFVVALACTGLRGVCERSHWHAWPSFINVPACMGLHGGHERSRRCVRPSFVVAPACAGLRRGHEWSHRCVRPSFVIAPACVGLRRGREWSHRHVWPSFIDAPACVVVVWSRMVLLYWCVRTVSFHHMGQLRRFDLVRAPIPSPITCSHTIPHSTRTAALSRPAPLCSPLPHPLFISG